MTGVGADPPPDRGSWVVRPEDLRVDERRDGISGLLRCKNEELTLAAAIESFLPGLDELVLVYNGCLDRTPEICERYAERYPERVRAVHYEPRVEPARSPEYRRRRIPDDSEESYANYYNFALCRSTRKIAVKVDAHLVALPGPWRRICDKVRAGLPEDARWHGKILTCAPTSKAPGERNLSLNRDTMSMVSNQDNPFFHVNRSTWYRYDAHADSMGYERLDCRSLPRERDLGVYALHVKTLKPALALTRGYPHRDFRDVDAMIEDAMKFNAVSGPVTLRQAYFVFLYEFLRVGLPFRIESHLEELLRRRLGFDVAFVRDAWWKDVLHVALHGRFFARELIEAAGDLGWRLRAGYRRGARAARSLSTSQRA